MNSQAAWSNRKARHSGENAWLARSTPDVADARCAPPISRDTAPIAQCWNPRARRRFRGVPQAPRRHLIPIPDSIPDDLAVFVEPLAAAYEIFEQTHLARNQTIVVLGDGRLGALIAMTLKGEKYLPIVAGHHREKLARLVELGLETAEESALRDKFDVVIDCTGNEFGLRRAIELVRPRGRIILKSTGQPRLRSTWHRLSLMKSL